MHHAVNWHNCTACHTGSFPADPNVSAHQRLTGKAPSCSDLCCIGSRAVVLKSDPQRSKSDLSTPGQIGIFLGRSRGSAKTYDVLCNGHVVSSSSVSVDEEYFPWLENPHRPLRPTAAVGAANGEFGSRDQGGEQEQGIESDRKNLTFLNLFSGPTSRADTLSAEIENFGWAKVIEIDKVR